MSHAMTLAGDVYLALLDKQGQLHGYIPKQLNVSELTLTPSEGQQLKQESRKRATYGQTLNQVDLPGAWSITLTNNELFQEYMQMILMGDLSMLNTPETVVTDEASTALMNLWVPFVNRGSVTGVSITSSDGATTYIMGTDYEVDGRNAMYRPLPGGNIADGQELLLDYTLQAKSGFTINGATRTSFDVALLLDGHNLANDHRVMLLVHHIKLKPQGGFDTMEQAIKSAQLGGGLLTPPHLNGPFIYQDLGPDPEA